VDRELDADAARLADALAHALGEHEVVPVARARSEPVWAMPMIGLPERSSSRLRP
jgi:hypothetical protein